MTSTNYTNRFTELSDRSAAVLGGTSLVLMALVAAFSAGFVLDALIVPGDAAATVAQLQDSELLFRAGIFGWLLILLLDVIAAWALYLFLRPVNQSVSLLTAWIRVVYAAILGIGISNLVELLPFIGDSTYRELFGTEQVQALVMVRVDAFYGAWQTIGLVIFGCHLMLLGYLVMKSDYIPRVIGFLLMLAAGGYIITNGGNLLLPRYTDVIATIETIFILPMIAGEVGLGLWLVVKGGRGKSFATQNQKAEFIGQTAQ